MLLSGDTSGEFLKGSFALRCIDRTDYDLIEVLGIPSLRVSKDTLGFRV